MSRRGRIRPRPVSFGNPALGTYGGCVYTLDVDESCSTPLIPAGATPVAHLVAMVNVPPEQVPEGILTFARSHRPFIEHVRIVISSATTSSSSTITATITETPSIPPTPPSTPLPTPVKTRPSLARVAPSPSVSAIESAASILANDKDDLHPYMTETRVRQQLLDLEHPSRTYLILFELQTQEAASIFVEDLHDKPYTSLDETQRSSVYHVVALQGDDGVSLMSPFFAPSFTRTRSASNDTSSPSNNATRSNQLTNSNNSSPSSNHDGTEVQNCAVCLEHMDLDRTSHYDGTAILTTVCNHSFHLDCILKWQDSPCPVCRYDHSGWNEALSQCHVCGTTEHNYVCLICGVVACGGNRSADGAACGGVPVRDLAGGPLSHARQHYDETLHAYALDTETQHVWDFAGQGFVHRLLQNTKDGKLVEVNDPNSTSEERTLSPGLSDAQEGEVVHRKLEGFATQYYTLLKSQLEQQRIYYEGRLQEIRSDYAKEGRKKPGSASADLISALKQERNQLAQRCMSLQRRCEKVTDDVAFLKSMNESLEANKIPMKRQVLEAQRERTDAREMIQRCLPPLEEKVTRLMLQLEENTTVEVECAPALRDRKPAAKC